MSGAASPLWRPLGVAAGSLGRLYVTDARARVVELVPDGGRRVLAGAHPGFANGLGTAALMREPSGIAVASDGRVVVADTLNGLVRVLDMPDRLGPWTPAPPCAGARLRPRALCATCRWCGRSTRRTARTKSPGRWASHAATPVATAASDFTRASTCAPTIGSAVLAVRDGTSPRCCRPVRSAR